MVSASTEPHETSPTVQAASRNTSSGRKTTRIIAAVLVLLLAGAGVFALVRDRNQLSSEVDRLQTKLDVARGDAGAEIASLESQIEELTAQLQVAQGALASSESELENEQNLLDAATTDLAQRSSDLAELKDQLAAVGGKVTPMPDLLGSTLEDAQAFADEAGAVLVSEEVQATNVIGRPGSIIEQLPIVDTAVLNGSVIWIQIFVASD